MKPGDEVVFFKIKASKSTEKIEAVLVKLNPHRATIRFPDGRTSSVALENIEKKNGTNQSKHQNP